MCFVSDGYPLALSPRSLPVLGVHRGSFDSNNLMYPNSTEAGNPARMVNDSDLLPWSTTRQRSHCCHPVHGYRSIR